MVIVRGVGVDVRRSAWVIWPTFSASVIRPSRSATRWLTGQRGVLVGRPAGGGADAGAGLGVAAMGRLPGGEADGEDRRGAEGDGAVRRRLSMMGDMGSRVLV